MARTPLGDDTPSEEVGYGRPPAQHQIREGEVRNPWGRRGKPKPVVDFLDATVTMTIDGKPRKIARREAIDYFLFSRAAKGDVRAIRLLDDRASRRQQSSSADTELSADDQAAFERFLRRAAPGRTERGQP